MEHSKGCTPVTHKSAEGKPQTSTFAASEVFWFRLDLIIIRKKGLLSSGGAGDVAPDKVLTPSH